MKALKVKPEQAKLKLKKVAITVVVLSAFLTYFAQLPETGSYFTHRVESHTYSFTVQ